MALNQAEFIKEYLVKYPDLPTHAMSKMIYNNHPLLFNSVENIRSIIRYHRGQNGKRNMLKDKTHMKELTYDSNPFKFPDSYKQETKIFNWPIKYSRVGILTDIHAPYHSVEAIEAALIYLRDVYKATGILLLGDLMDFNKISRWESEPDKPTTVKEFEVGRQILRIIRNVFPDALIIWATGNHDRRWEQYLLNKAPEIFGDPDFTLSVRMKTDELNIQVINENSIIKLGRLNATHGHKLKGANNAQTLLNKTNVDSVMGHIHKDTEFTKVAMDGSHVTCYTVACLCELNPTYNPFANQYRQGFATCTILNESDYEFDNKRIINGKIVR